VPSLEALSTTITSKGIVAGVHPNDSRQERVRAKLLNTGMMIETAGACGVAGLGGNVSWLEVAGRWLLAGCDTGGVPAALDLGLAIKSAAALVPGPPPCRDVRPALPFVAADFGVGALPYSVASFSTAAKP